MSVFQTLKGLVSALFAPAEDPRKTLAYTYHHQNELLAKVREAIEDMRTARVRLNEKMDAARARIPDLESEAQAALAADDEAQARFLLQRRQIALVELEGLESQVGDVGKEEMRLTLIEQRLSTQIEALLARQELISARHSAAEAQVYINQEIGSVSEELSELDLALADAEARAERLHERASTLEEIASVNMLNLPGQVSTHKLQESIQKLKLADAVEETLEQMKQGHASKTS